MSVSESIADIAIIDVDAHISEPHDLWTSRAPAAYKDRMPRVTEVNGEANGGAGVHSEIGGEVGGAIPEQTGLDRAKQS